MSTPLNFKLQQSGGAYGTHSSCGSNGSNSAASSNHHHPSHTSSASTSTTSTTRRRANNPPESLYGPFSSPHASFDDPLSFPPYAELPFTALKRRKQLQSGGGPLFVKWAMRGVLLSPVIALVLWSIAVTVFIRPQHGVARGSTGSNSSMRPQQARRGGGGFKRMLPNFMGNAAPQQQQNIVYLQDGQQLQQTENGMMMVVTPQQRQQAQPLDANGMTMVVTPQQRQQAQIQEGNGMMMVVTPQRQQQAQPLDANGMAMVVTPQQRQQAQIQEGNGMMMVVTPQRQQSQATAQVPDQQYMAVQQQQQSGKHIPVVGPLGSSMEQSSSQGTITDVAVQQQQQDVALQATMTDGTGAQAAAAGEPVMASVGDVQQQQEQVLDAALSTGGTQVQPAASMQQQQPQQLSDSSSTTQYASPVKQTIYYYDPNDTTLSQNGDILQLPKVVYDANGKAVPLSELRQAPIYVQPPMMGATADSGSNSLTNGSSNAAFSSGVDSIDTEVAPAREAVKLPKWGTSTSQDQTIIVATVAVMALLVGALSARRLRSKSFLASCIENETLEDDLAYDSAYTTTAGMGGADSSYNTFGGWKGDLEKFDV